MGLVTRSSIIANSLYSPPAAFSPPPCTIVPLCYFSCAFRTTTSLQFLRRRHSFYHPPNWLLTSCADPFSACVHLSNKMNRFRVSSSTFKYCMCKDSRDANRRSRWAPTLLNDNMPKVRDSDLAVHTDQADDDHLLLHLTDCERLNSKNRRTESVDVFNAL
ncbi:uncharacterized protein EI90DRAFT_1789760 [Cantharellus anzutake]|uniref:uncharacterized protein n=1 Tax=Cantharellus anzutake TaxID=1750568 RepID=UPI00190447F5|nr:uncharacterized protein EI90DRAFT_1789760 [Cantharellus anzutake]KAF8327398.1 hypothetical protein EI90DRAFT_1789760 [Cantharellus anzutake]